jgi:hypothetical protein
MASKRLKGDWDVSLVLGGWIDGDRESRMVDEENELA